MGIVHHFSSSSPLALSLSLSFSSPHLSPSLNQACRKYEAVAKHKFHFSLPLSVRERQLLLAEVILALESVARFGSSFGVAQSPPHKLSPCSSASSDLPRRISHTVLSPHLPRSPRTFPASFRPLLLGLKRTQIVWESCAMFINLWILMDTYGQSDCLFFVPNLLEGMVPVGRNCVVDCRIR